MKNKRAIIEEITLRTLFICSATGLVTGILSIFLASSFASLIFLGNLSPYLLKGIGMTLFSCCLLNIVIPLFSSYKGLIASPQASVISILSVIGISVVENLNRQTADEYVFYTLFMTIILSSLFMGIAFSLLGYFQLGNILYYIPYPIIAGILAGSALLLMQQTFYLITGIPLHFSNLLHFLQGDLIIKWLPGILFSILLYHSLKRFKHFIALPTILIGSTIIFFLPSCINLISISDLYANGWLLGPFPEKQIWQPLSPSIAHQINYYVILKETPKIITLVVVGLISLLLTESSLSLTFEKNTELNRDLFYTGLANIFSSLGGGIAGLPSKTLSLLAHKPGTSIKLVGLITALICAWTLSFGSYIISLFPKAILGGLLFYISWNLFYKWLIDSFRKVNTSDYIIIVLIASLVGFVGVSEGLVLSIISGGLIFIFNYNRLNIIKYSLSGSHYRSNVDRSEEFRDLLREKGKNIYIIKLQGYIFFATANALLKKVEERIYSKEEESLQYLILDFQYSNGIDSSAITSFLKMSYHAKENDCTILLSHLSPEDAKILNCEKISPEYKSFIHYFLNMDGALEWCENELLNLEKIKKKETASLEKQIKRIIPNTGEITSLIQSFQKITINKEEFLIRQGEFSKDVFFIESGEVSVELDLPENNRILLRKMKSGSILGEISLYLETPRSASVIAKQKTIAYKITKKTLDSLKEKDPASVAAFHEYIAKILAKRLCDTNDLLKSIIE